MMKGAAVIFATLLNLSAELPTQASVVVVPLGSVSRSKVQAVANQLSKTFHIRVSVARPEALPKSAYYAPRKRYRADKLLAWLADRAGTGYVMGVTSSDVSTRKGSIPDWGVFGLGQMPGRASVVSDFRLGRKGSVSPQEWLLRVATHEFGHNLGLPHGKRTLPDERRGGFDQERGFVGPVLPGVPEQPRAPTGTPVNCRSINDPTEPKIHPRYHPRK